MQQYTIDELTELVLSENEGEYKVALHVLNSNIQMMLLMSHDKATAERFFEKIKEAYEELVF